MIDPWTSQVQVIDIVSELYERTAKLVEAPGPDAPQSKAVAKARRQLPELVGVLFATYHERLNWLGRLVDFAVSPALLPTLYSQLNVDYLDATRATPGPVGSVKAILPSMNLE